MVANTGSVLRSSDIREVDQEEIMLKSQCNNGQFGQSINNTKVACSSINR